MSVEAMLKMPKGPVSHHFTHKLRQGDSKARLTADRRAIDAIMGIGHLGLPSRHPQSCQGARGGTGADRRAGLLDNLNVAPVPGSAGVDTYV